MKIQTTKNNLFFYLLILTSFFLLLEISFFIQCNKDYLADFTYVNHHLPIPSAVLPDIFYFIFVQLSIHLAYCLIIWCFTCLISDLFNFSSQRDVYLGIFLWVWGLLTALAANQYFFPNSKFAELTQFVLVGIILKPVLIFLLTGLAIFIFLALIDLIKKLMNMMFFYLLLVVGFLLIGAMFFLKPAHVMTSAASVETPNVILIGVDSLRPDFLSYSGNQLQTPFFDSFLNQSTVFTKALTPLARTFPAWGSILTGKYPKQTGIRTDLAALKQVELSGTLANILHHHGYETIFATDETRFSNIDENFGFDHIVSSPMGLNDFLLGTFNDFPLSNLLVNTSLGKWLFPYSYANRAVYFLYEPDTFLNLLQNALAAPRAQPLFLAVHFCLPHNPYLWAGFAADGSDALTRYRASIAAADKQVQDFFGMLKEYHLLDHAIVVLLSDHGEALELAGDRITEKNLFLPGVNNKAKKIPLFYPPSLDEEAVNQSAGHGTDVLGLPQYHSVLAFRMYNVIPYHTGQVANFVSLLDIKPTILNLLHFASSNASLVPFILAKENPLSAPIEDIFLESDFSPQSIRTVYPQIREAVLSGMQLFAIDPVTTRLTFKDTMDQMVMKSKQYADIYGEWMLALYPQNKNYRIPILINLSTGKWTNDLQSDFAKNAPVMHMLVALKKFYGDEIRYSKSSLRES